MSWFADLSATEPVASSVLVLAAIAVLGLAVGHVKIAGVRLGVAGVLFAGILFGHFQVTIAAETLGFGRDFGLILFVYTILSIEGLQWVACGAVITLVPLLVAAWIGRSFMQLNFIDLCGLLSGSMTDPPALAFAQAINGSDAPSVAYSTVYPLTMVMRILVAQLLVVLFAP